MKVADKILRALGKDKEALSLLFVNDPAIRRLNRQYRKIDTPTDVLSFPLNHQRVRYGSPLLGDIVISVETARRQARELGHILERELTFLLIHGILHLLGWDHERSPQEARRMYKKQRELLSLLDY